MNKILSVVCFSAVFIQGTLLPKEHLSPQENIFLRRITEFWKDKDYALVKKQITEFLSANPLSPLSDHLYAILGDLYFQENNFAEAVSAYRHIHAGEFQEKTLYSHASSLYVTNDYAGVVALAQPFYVKGTLGRMERGHEIHSILGDSFYRIISAEDNAAKKKELAQIAKPILQSLASQEQRALYFLADIHRYLEEFPEACTFYMMLADKDASKREEFLAQAASLQLSFDKTSAAATYGKIAALGGPKASDAAYNQFALLFQAQNYAELCGAQEEISKHLAPEHQALFQLCLGRSYFFLENYAKAASSFEKYLEKQHDKNALIMLLICAQKTQDTPLFDRVLDDLAKTYPQDPEVARALLIHAQHSVEQRDLSAAASDLGKVLAQFPDIDNREVLLYDHALLLSQTQDWAGSRLSFLKLIEHFPDTTHKNQIFQYLLTCSLEQMKAAPEDLTIKQQLVFDLQNALSSSSFPETQKSSYVFLLGKAQFELEQYGPATETLQSFLNAYPDSPSANEAHLLSALSLREQGIFDQAFAQHAENVLANSKDAAPMQALHRDLFNAYRQIGNWEKAAEHLFQAYVVGSEQIQDENKVWLASFYFDKAKAGDTHAREKALALYPKLLALNGEKMAPDAVVDHPLLETEVLKFSSLLPPTKKALLLSSLNDLQETNPQVEWKLQRQALFELGKTYASLQESQKALDIFNHLIESAASSYFSSAAQLERARLLFAACPEEKRNEENPQIIEILSTLKDLQIQKKIYSEPLHLEAALEYADIRTSLAAPEKRLETALFFLSRIKEDFTGAENPALQEYQEAQTAFPEKSVLYHNYLKCIDAEISRLQALQCRKAKEVDQAKALEQTAQGLLSEVLADKEATSFLQQRAELNLSAIKR